eukprot:6133052-Amphidinium_carterae.3
MASLGLVKWVGYRNLEMSGAIHSTTLGLDRSHWPWQMESDWSRDSSIVMPRPHGTEVKLSGPSEWPSGHEKA